MITNIASTRSNSWRLSLVSTAVIALAACNSSSDSDISLAEIQAMPVSDAKLTNASALDVKTTLHNGLYLTATGQAGSGSCINCEFVTLDSSAQGRGNQGNFSVTTTQEGDVDESDRVKYDGNTLFIASNSDGYSVFEDEISIEQSQQPGVRVLQRNSDSSLTEQAYITAGEKAAYMTEMYLHDDKLAMFYEVNYETANSGDSAVARSDIWLPYANKLGVAFQNVEQVSTPQELANMTIDGYMISSRRIGDKVYLVSRYSPSVDEEITIPVDADQSQLQTLYREIAQTQLSDMMPKVYLSSGEEKPLVRAEDCYLPEQHSSNYGFTTVTTVTTFDLNSPGDFQSTCVLAPLDGFYSSSDNMYLYEKQYLESSETHNTVIHKFSFDQQGVKYMATGAVPGHVSWNNAHLRFSEKDDYLRVITSEQDFSTEQNLRNHRLFVLKQDGEQNLQRVAQLPNDQYPDKIGKPDEDIFAVRYFADKAYVVTFRQIDPLYVINLADPTKPYIEGELEIPGYSGYLQPINDNFVLGIGQQLDPNARPGEPLLNQPDSTLVQGAKVELYDVSNPNDPKVAASLVFEDLHSAAEWDYRALTQLQVSDNKYKFAFPLGGWNKVSLSDEVEQWNYQQKMQLVELDVSASGTLTDVGALQPKSEYFGQWGDRAVLHDDLVYYIRNNNVWQSLWSQPDLLNGPF